MAIKTTLTIQIVQSRLIWRTVGTGMLTSIWQTGRLPPKLPSNVSSFRPKHSHRNNQKDPNHWDGEEANQPANVGRLTRVSKRRQVGPNVACGSYGTENPPQAKAPQVRDDGYGACEAGNQGVPGRLDVHRSPASSQPGSSTYQSGRCDKGGERDD